MAARYPDHVNFIRTSLRVVAAAMIMVVVLTSCKEANDETVLAPDDKVLAVVNDHQLLLSEVRPLLQDTTSSKDSVIFIQNYTERWVRDQLLISEAEKNTPEDIDIDQLVKDYRSSLLVYHFEQQLLRERLDTIVTEEEILEFYKKNKGQFQNDKDLVRAYFIKMKKPFPNQKMMESWWEDPNGSNLQELRKYCQNYATYFNLDKNKWIEYKDISEQIPRGRIRFKDLGPDYNRNFADFTHHYLIKVFEAVKASDNAPVSLIADQVKMIILHERKIKLLEKIKQELYDNAIQNSSVKILTK